MDFHSIKRQNSMSIFNKFQLDSNKSNLISSTKPLVPGLERIKTRSSSGFLAATARARTAPRESPTK
jgi:hypothetical protein